MTTCIETRQAYGDAMRELGERFPNAVMLDADLYKSTFSVRFREMYPQRFFDMGIAEADMVSTAAGMAASGLIPFCNSFAIFVTGVCYMPIRTQIAYPALPVKLVGSSSGLTEGPDGASHQALEDVALMRVLPNMTVVVPADGEETRQTTLTIAAAPGPAYMRLGRYPVPCVTPAGYRFEIGKAPTLREGGDVVIYAAGHMVCKALEAAEQLAKERIEARVINVSTIKPLDEAAVQAGVAGVVLAVSVEEHSILGGLGSAIAECLTQRAGAPRLLRLGVRDRFGETGQAEELLEKFRLTSPQIAADIRAALP